MKQLSFYLLCHILSHIKYKHYIEDIYCDTLYICVIFDTLDIHNRENTLYKAL